MSYIGFEEYRGLGGKLDHPGFTAAEPRAEALLDAATLCRLRSRPGLLDAFRAEVASAMMLCIEALPAIEAASAESLSGSAPLTSFSNGVNSLGFGGSDSTPYERAEAALAGRLAAVLPVELCSSCAVYNRAR